MYVYIYNIIYIYIYSTYMSSLLLSWRVASIHSQRANLRLSVLLRLEVAESGQGLHLSRFSWPLLRPVRYTYPDCVIVWCICVPGTGFVRTSDRFCLPGTCTTLRWFSATRSCSPASNGFGYGVLCQVQHGWLYLLQHSSLTRWWQPHWYHSQPIGTEFPARYFPPLTRA